MATFETAFYQQRREEQNPHTIGTAERYTGESILQREKICKWIEEDQPLDKLLSQEKDWWYYYHLSVMRQGLFAWYPFKKEAVWGIDRIILRQMQKSSSDRNLL